MPKKKDLENTRLSIKPYDIIFKKKIDSTKYKKLINYKWGIGIEHEMHLFHLPFGIKYSTVKNKKNITDFTIFNSFNPVLRILKNKDKYKLKLIDQHFLEEIPFEPTGRKCNGKWVIKKTPFNMPEFITTEPFSTLKEGKKSIELYCDELQDLELRFYHLLLKDPIVNKQIKKYGALTSFPFSMTDYLSIPKNTNTSIYKFDKDKNKDNKIYTEYLGSYHITITLPYTNKTSNINFIKKHSNFANQLQWLEPLLVTSFFSSDQKAVGTIKKRVKGSFRVVRVGWGNFAGSDVRKFNEGIGRYSDIPTYWRDDLEYYEKDKLKPCLTPTPPAKREGGISALSSNFRTFGSTDPDRPWHRESGAPMTKPNGIEFRIFDHFPIKYLKDLCRIIIYIAENSRVTETKKYVYKNKNWINTMHNIMLNGWSAEIDINYINDLRKNLGLKINTNSIIAYDVFKVIVKELFEKNKDGDWTYLMLDKKYIKPPIVPEINRKSWQLGFIMKLNRDKKILDAFNNLIKNLPNNNIYIKKEFEDYIYNEFNINNESLNVIKNKWKNNINDIAYFMEDNGIIKINYFKNKKIKSIKVIKRIKYNNFNDIIKTYFVCPNNLISDYFNSIPELDYLT